MKKALAVLIALFLCFVDLYVPLLPVGSILLLVVAFHKGTRELVREWFNALDSEA